MNKINGFIFIICSIFSYSSMYAMSATARRAVPAVARTMRTTQPIRVARTAPAAPQTSEPTQNTPDRMSQRMYREYIRPALCAGAVCEQMATSYTEADAMLEALEQRLSDIRARIMHFFR